MSVAPSAGLTRVGAGGGVSMVEDVDAVLLGSVEVGVVVVSDEDDDGDEDDEDEGDEGDEVDGEVLSASGGSTGQAVTNSAQARRLGV